jgi:CBS domain containing-hemolysin-like protein
MVPKSLALQHAEQLACWITPPMLWTKTMLFPFVVGLNGLGNLLLRGFGVNRQVKNSDHYYTPEELQLIVQESEELGALRSESGQMLQELFEFGDLTAGQAMVPRVRISGIPVGTTPDRIREILAESAHTRYPVYEKDLDHIVGMMHIKDLLQLLLENQPMAAGHARGVPVVPETAELDSVLDVMRRERTQMAVVIDEHGGTAGVLTLEDVLEEIVGDVDDEHDEINNLTAGVVEGVFAVAGTLHPDEVLEASGFDVPDGPYETLAGYMLERLGRIPAAGDRVRRDGWTLEVAEMDGRRIASVQLTAPAGRRAGEGAA